MASSPRTFFIAWIVAFSICYVLLISFFDSHDYRGLAGASEQETGSGPSISDSELDTEIVFDGLDSPTSMAFLGSDDILVLEKNNGTVQRIVDGKMLDDPALDVNVANKWTRGLLGIDIAGNSTTGMIYVFLYYTESSGGKDGNDQCPGRVCNPAEEPLGNRLYRYEFRDGKLVDPKLLLDLPATPWPSENGGPVRVGPDTNVYLVIGDLMNPRTIMSNNGTGLPPDGTSGILRVTQDGRPVGKGILGNEYPLNLYYAYGIRNSFGMDFDPVTGNLWDTENGPEYGDEINLVEPGFNSGWMKVQGVWEPKSDVGDQDKLNHPGETVVIPGDLMDFRGKGRYHAPQFTWNETVAPTDLTFLGTDKLGEEYKDDLFVAASSGKIYRFELNNDRTQLVLEASLNDRIAESSKPEDLEDIIFGQDFGVITDLEVGPDGNLYVLSYTDGTIYRIEES